MIAGLTGCATKGARPVELRADQVAAAEKAGLTAERAAELEAKPLFKMTEPEVSDYIAYASQMEPNLPDRVVMIGRKNIGQPYELYLLGEAPFETYDPQPLYCIDRSDCVVFSEHTYAMALSQDWPQFFAMLQRIRYRDGQIGVLTRNHYTEADWNIQNSWLVRDITEDLGGFEVARYTQTVNRAKFFENRYKLITDVPNQKITVSYIPLEKIPAIESQLRNGDFVNVIVGTDKGGEYATHVGLVAIGSDGTVNFLHSTPPQVREEPLAVYIQRGVDAKPERIKKGRAYLKGFKFLRLEDDPVGNLRQIDGPNAPIVRPPAGATIPGG